jgi:hypothetical protein
MAKKRKTKDGKMYMKEYNNFLKLKKHIEKNGKLLAEKPKSDNR